MNSEKLPGRLSRRMLNESWDRFFQRRLQQPLAAGAAAVHSERMMMVVDGAPELVSARHSEQMALLGN